MKYANTRISRLRWFMVATLVTNAIACSAGDQGASLAYQEEPPSGGQSMDDAIAIPDPVEGQAQGQPQGQLQENPPQTPAENPLVPNPQKVELSEFESKAIELTNAERQRYGLAPLSVNPRLQGNCRSWAGTMARQRRMYHSNMSFSGENVAWGYATPAAVVRGWMNSPGHRANILTGSFRTIGVGVVSSYWCQQFGR